MAKMDFSAKCRIERRDEIGNLASTLNYLSGSLESTLEKLYDANDKLKKDLDLQKELDMLRKDFIVAITHEFKTPITLIRGYSESIKDNVAHGEDREFAVDTIINETERIDKLVNDLLDLSTLESIGYKLNISNFSADDLLNDIARKYGRVMEDRGINFRTDIEKSNMFVSGDSFRIEQVITNLLNNAINHTKAGKEIILSLGEENGHILVSVQNQGVQIGDEDRKRLWEKFYRIERSRNKKYGGSGLGLAISSAILKLHNSSFGVENTSDGVRFYFTLEKSKASSL
jgi:signal transduction histidine kinase